MTIYHKWHTLKTNWTNIRIRALEDELERRKSINSRIQFVLIVILMVYIALYYLFMVLGSLKMFPINNISTKK